MIPNNLQTINSLSLSDTPDILNVLNSDQDQPSTAILPNTQSIIPTTSIATNSAFSTPSFEDSLSNASLPPPGPSYYAARRALWLNPTPGHPLPQVPSTSRQKLEQLLSAPGAVESEETWKSGIERVWKGLVTGEKLKRRLPMNLVVHELRPLSDTPVLSFRVYRSKSYTPDGYETRRPGHSVLSHPSQTMSSKTVPRSIRTVQCPRSTRQALQRLGQLLMEEPRM